MEGRQTIAELINSSFPDNNQKLITASGLRTFLEILCDSKFNLADDDIGELEISIDGAPASSVRQHLENLNNRLNDESRLGLEVAFDSNTSQTLFRQFDGIASGEPFTHQPPIVLLTQFVDVNAGPSGIFRTFTRRYSPPFATTPDFPIILTQDSIDVVGTNSDGLEASWIRSAAELEVTFTIRLFSGDYIGRMVAYLKR